LQDTVSRLAARRSKATDWLCKNAYLLADVNMRAAAFLETFVEYPPSQRPASFSIDQIRRQIDKKIKASFKARGLE